MTENRHAKFAKYWADQGKPELEVKCSDEPDTAFCTLLGFPSWHQNKDYRFAGDPHWALRLAWINSDFTLPIEVLDSGGATWRLCSLPQWEPNMSYRISLTANVPAVSVGEESVSVSVPDDPGAHYRYTYTVKLTEADIAAREKTIKLDPARICKIYGISDMMQQFLVKKGLRAGTGGYKDLKQEIADLHNALDRWLEMLEEDGVV